MADRTADLEAVTADLRLQIDERRRAEEALSGTRAQLMDAIESLDAGLVMYGPDERMVVCNSKYKEIYAAVAHTMVPGTPYEDILRRSSEPEPFRTPGCRRRSGSASG